MNRRDLLLFRTVSGLRVFELPCERLYMRYVDSRRPCSPAPALDEYWLGEPDPHFTLPGPRELFDGLRHDLADAAVLRVVGRQWLADAGFRAEVDALVEAVRAGGGRVEFADGSSELPPDGARTSPTPNRDVR
jgi:hypothetical protein